MYRVFLIPTEEFPRKELWIVAATVREAEDGEFWEFLDGDHRVTRRLPKIAVREFETAADRRASRTVATGTRSSVRV